ncbi:MAG: hypothetical protein ACYDGM_00465 [Vulcanimicrobiaceae bacterium]
MKTGEHTDDRSPNVNPVKTMLRYAGAPLTLVAILGLALIALAFVPASAIPHTAAHTIAYWMFNGHS